MRLISTLKNEQDQAPKTKSGRADYIHFPGVWPNPL